jgi:hypothetical protein
MPQLKEITTITMNQISSKDLSENGDLKFAYPQHLLANNSVDWDQCKNIDSKNPKIKVIVNVGDIIIVIKGGRAGQIFSHNENTPFVTGQTCAVIKSSETNLFNKIVAKKEEIRSMIKGIAINHISLKSLLELEV